MNFHLSSGFESLRFVFCCRRQEHYGISLELWLCERCEWGRGRFWAWRTISHKKWRKYGNLVNEKYAKMTEKKTSRIACKNEEFSRPRRQRELRDGKRRNMCMYDAMNFKMTSFTVFGMCRYRAKNKRESRVNWSHLSPCLIELQFHSRYCWCWLACDALDERFFNFTQKRLTSAIDEKLNWYLSLIVTCLRNLLEGMGRDEASEQREWKKERNGSKKGIT